MAREYNHVSDEQRRQLLAQIKAGKNIRQASEAVGMNYENAKAINRIYRDEERTDKKTTRNRLKRGENREAFLARRP